MGISAGRRGTEAPHDRYGAARRQSASGLATTEAARLRPRCLGAPVCPRPAPPEAVLGSQLSQDTRVAKFLVGVGAT
jgi:hypothetical protein